MPLLLKAEREGFEKCVALLDIAKRRRPPDRRCEKALSSQKKVGAPTDAPTHFKRKERDSKNA